MNNIGKITFRESPARKINRTLKEIADGLGKMNKEVKKTNDILEKTNEIWEEFLRVSKLKPLGPG